MAGMIQVVPAELRRKADELRNQEAVLRTRIEDLVSQEGTLGTMWEGDAHTTFKAAFNGDVVKMHSFCTAILEYATALEDIAAKYEIAENKNINIAQTRTV